MDEHNFVELPICKDCLANLRDSLEETIARQIHFLEALEAMFGESEEVDEDFDEESE